MKRSPPSPAGCAAVRPAASAWAVFLSTILTASVLAQRDAPVWESYLPRIALFHDSDEAENRALVLDFAFRKSGGPHEHTEHQCYILACLKGEEQAILKMAQDPELTDKKSGKPSLLDVLVEKKLAVVLDTKVAKLNSADGKTPRFPDVTGKPGISGPKNLDSFAFPFTFTFKEGDLFDASGKLAGVDLSKFSQSGDSKYYRQELALLVFIPVNDSKHADKVAANIRDKHDFAHEMNTRTSILHFKVLPYTLSFVKYADQPVRVQVN